MDRTQLAQIEATDRANAFELGFLKAAQDAGLTEVEYKQMRKMAQEGLTYDGLRLGMSLLHDGATPQANGYFDPHGAPGTAEERTAALARGAAHSSTLNPGGELSREFERGAAQAVDRLSKRPTVAGQGAVYNPRGAPGTDVSRLNDVAQGARNVQKTTPTSEVAREVTKLMGPLKKLKARNAAGTQTSPAPAAPAAAPAAPAAAVKTGAATILARVLRTNR